MCISHRDGNPSEKWSKQGINVARSTSEQILAFSPNPDFHREKCQGETLRRRKLLEPPDVGTQPLLVDRSSLSGRHLHWKPSHYKGSKRFQQAGYSKASELHYRLWTLSDASAFKLAEASGPNTFPMFYLLAKGMLVRCRDGRWKTIIPTLYDHNILMAQSVTQQNLP